MRNVNNRCKIEHNMQILSVRLKADYYQLKTYQAAQLWQRDRATRVGDFKGVGYFEATFLVEGLGP